MESKETSNEYLRGTLKTIVLNLLSDGKRMYGYEMTQQVRDHTSGEIQLTFGALYPVLHRLEQEGALITETEEVDGRLRKYYRLTDLGTKKAMRKKVELERFLEALQGLMHTPIPKPMEN